MCNILYFSVIASGGLTTPGHFLKAMALGADADYIGSIALMALLQTQMTKALPTEPPPQIPLTWENLKRTWMWRRVLNIWLSF
jgi:glutamate synthase domain-containing protein 2